MTKIYILPEEMKTKITMKDLEKKMQQQTTKYWFKAKTYGYGWTPATWQGWGIIEPAKWRWGKKD